MNHKRKYILRVIVVIMSFVIINVPIIGNTVGIVQSETTEGTGCEGTTPDSSTSIMDNKTQESTIDSSQESTESTTSSSNKISMVEDKQETQKESEIDKIALAYNEDYWWDTINNRGFTYNDDIPFWSGGKSEINTSQGYIELGEPYIFETGWKFVNITFRGNIYSSGDRIYDELFKGILNYQEIEKQLRYNYEPQLYNVKISYRGLPDEIKETLPKVDPNPILNGTMYTIPAPPKVEGYVTEEFALVWTAPFFMPRMIGSETYISGGTLSDEISYGYKPEDELIAQPIIVHYLDINGNTINEEDSIIGGIDEDYTISAKTIPGYTLVKTEGATS